MSIKLNRRILAYLHSLCKIDFKAFLWGNFNIEKKAIQCFILSFTESDSGNMPSARICSRLCWLQKSSYLSTSMTNVNQLFKEKSLTWTPCNPSQSKSPKFCREFVHSGHWVWVIPQNICCSMHGITPVVHLILSFLQKPAKKQKKKYFEETES